MQKTNMFLPRTGRLGKPGTSSPVTEVYLARHLKTQSQRADAVGDLARDAARDSRFPKRGTLAAYDYHLQLSGATLAARLVLDSVFEEAKADPKMVVSRAAKKAPLEITIENYFQDRVKALGGREVKMGMNGWPDRVVVIGGRTGFLELKRPGEKPRALQLRRIGWLRAAGATADWADTRETVDAFLSELMK
jgi:hypothetical protein